MEKIVDMHIRKELLERHPLHAQQFAYQKGKSTETALHYIVGKIEDALCNREIALCAFLDIEGAFDNTSYGAIEVATKEKGADLILIRWIKTMLDSRRIRAKKGTVSTRIRATKGCPQGGVLSPLLWTLVVDSLLKMLSEAGYEVIGYADDIVVIVRGKFQHVLKERIQQALRLVTRWCSDQGLSVNPEKTKVVPFTRKRDLNMEPIMVEGAPVQITDEIKYLGVTLDKKLTWNSHLNKQIEKAKASIWACRRLCGRTWGMSPRMLHWLYTAVVRPMVTYAALVWWTKTEEATAVAKLERIQRMVCLGITGAISTCPTAAMEALTGLTPLSIYIKREAMMGALRLQSLGQGRKELKGHLRILKMLEESELFLTQSDEAIRTLLFDKKFRVAIPSRQSWEEKQESSQRGSLVWYTDGSLKDERAGVGIYGPNTKIAKALGTYVTVFQSEVHAIEIAARENLKKGLKGQRIYINSDSQAALKALESHSCSSKLVMDCHSVLNDLGRNNKVTLVWVPGHEGIVGNETADELARRGSEEPFYGPEPFCGISRSFVRNAVNTWEKEEIKKNWNARPGMRQAKLLVSLEKDRAKHFLQLARVDLRKIVALLTGHGPLRKHLCTMGLMDDPTCRLCLEEEETSLHILCECEALAYNRLVHFGRAVVTPKEIAEATPKELKLYARGCKVVWE